MALILIAVPTWSEVEATAILITVVLIAFLLFGIWKAIQSHREKPTTGREGIIGERGVTVTELDPHGQVELRGEVWRATSTRGKLDKGQSVAVVEQKGLTLVVERV